MKAMKFCQNLYRVEISTQVQKILPYSELRKLNSAMHAFENNAPIIKLKFNYSFQKMSLAFLSPLIFK